MSIICQNSFVNVLSLQRCLPFKNKNNINKTNGCVISSGKHLGNKKLNADIPVDMFRDSWASMEILRHMWGHCPCNSSVDNFSETQKFPLRSFTGRKKKSSNFTAANSNLLEFGAQNLVDCIMSTWAFRNLSEKSWKNN